MLHQQQKHENVILRHPVVVMLSADHIQYELHSALQPPHDEHLHVGWLSGSNLLILCGKAALS